MTKTSPDCDATVLSISQPDGVPDDLLERLKDRADPYAGSNSDHELIQEAVDEIERLSALAATPAVGGEAFQPAADFIYEETTKLGMPISMGASLFIAKRLHAMWAAQPASPLRGRKPVAWIIGNLELDFSTMVFFSEESAIEHYERSKSVLPKWAKIEPVYASPPEQPAADPVTK